jgi:translation initiation factor IF-3
VPEVRLIGEDGNQIGVMKTPDALVYAQERDLDLVEVAPDARPPVCRVLDYSKYKYEQAQKQKAARKHQQQITIREIKFRPKIAQNDYDTKKGHVSRFLLGKDKVKVTIMFRGREVTHPERGVALLNKLAEELSEIGVVEQMPIQDGRNMTMMLGPSKSVLATEDEKPEAEEEHRGGKRHHKHDDNVAARAEVEEAEVEEVADDEVEAQEPDEVEADETETDDIEAEGPDADQPEAKAAPAKPKPRAASQPKAAAQPEKTSAAAE